ncbi:MAG TPA: HDIG domain-containing protein [Candidatus Rifleibacterium sp.]|nr:HDIG domain-containing protein [Candidatus Rifleibacterium sp.]HPT48131.1 HDIG domain-containing protein [Candidatus Rifleibacterium sp.]
MLKRLLARILYRIWQFKQVLLPRLDRNKWDAAVAELAPQVRNQLAALKKSEKAHIMRVYDDINNDAGLQPDMRQYLLTLALLHDIGKSVTRPSLLFKVAKVLLPIANTEHCLAGARLLRQFRQNRQLIRRVLRHHDLEVSDAVLKLFQQYDDRN